MADLNMVDLFMFDLVKLLSYTIFFSHENDDEVKR